MKNLLKFEFTKLKKKKSFYICTLIMVALLFISALTMNALITVSAEFGELFEVSSIDSLISGLNDSSFVMITSIFVVLFVCEDYTNHTVKNVYARGYSRKEVYLSKLISTLASATIMFVVVEIAAFAIGTGFFGSKEMGSPKLLAILGTQYVVAMANIVLAFMAASAIRKNGGAIAFIILAPTLVSIVTGLADVFLNLENLSITSLWISNFLSEVSDLTAETKDILICFVGSLIYIPVFGFLGLYLNQKADV